MNFRKDLKLQRSAGLDWIPYVNVFLLFVVFFMFSPVFTASEAVGIKLPKAVTSDIAGEKNIVIIVTSENILYHKNRIVTIEELRDLLSRPGGRYRPVLIKADRRASLGRIADVWGLARGLGVEHVNVATGQED